MRQLAAGKFKDICLRTLDEVAAGHGPVVITKWGRPVAQLVRVIRPETGADAGDSRGVGPSEAREAAVEYRVETGGGEAPPRERGAGGRETADERLRRMAAELGIPPEALLHQALDAWHGPDSLDKRIAAARRAVGAYRSGHTDTARNHDEVFVEAAMDSRR